MKTYIIEGAAFVSVECQAYVKADSQEEALRVALRTFKQNGGSLVVPNSADDKHPFDWAPLEITQCAEAAED